jgi:nitroreductase
VSDPVIKRKIREEAEAVERAFYAGHAPSDLLEDLVPLGTGPEKPFLEDAPYLIAIFARLHEVISGGRRARHPYALESTGIATGVLIVAIHRAGLVTVPYTPSPMAFLGPLLGRPRGEKGFAILPVGYPAEGACVPDCKRRPEDEILSIL